MTKCPVCQSPEFKLIGFPEIGSETKKFIRHEFKVVQCDECCLYFVNPAIDFTAQEWAALYGVNYFSAKTNYYYKVRKRARQKRLRTLLKLKHDSKRILDVGCGEGHVLIEAKSVGLSPFGLDIFDNRIDEAKSKDINFELGTLPEAGYSENYFDIIFLDSVLEHVTDPLNYLETSYRLLKPGGVLYAGVPNEDCLLNYFRQVFYYLTGRRSITSKIKPFMTPYHIIGFNRYSLNFILNKTGYDIKKVRNFAGRLQFLYSSPGSRQFFINMITEPISILAFFIRREEYLEVYVQKPVK